MSNIDIVALRKFQEQWKPVVDAIPAVLEMAERKADLDRALEKHKSDVEKARKTAEQEMRKAADAIEKAQADYDALLQKQRELQSSIADTHAQAEIARQEAADSVGKAQADAKAATNKIVSQAKQAQADALAEALRAKTAHADTVLLFEAEIKDLEDRRTKAEKALAALRAKLE